METSRVSLTVIIVCLGYPLPPILLRGAGVFLAGIFLRFLEVFSCANLWWRYSPRMTNAKPMMTIEECRAEELKELQSGKITVKWSQSNAGYRIRAGRNAVLGLETFVTESDAWEYLKENHGIIRP